jgi:hypothetical protein
MQQPFQQNAFGHQPFGQNAFQQSPFGQNAFQQNAFGQQSFQPGGFGSGTSQQKPFGQQSHFPATEAPGTGLQDTAPEAFSTAEDREEALKTLLSMGFDREISEKALRASFYNLETAIEYITSV